MSKIGPKKGSGGQFGRRRPGNGALVALLAELRWPVAKLGGWAAQGGCGRCQVVGQSRGWAERRPERRVGRGRQAGELSSETRELGAVGGSGSIRGCRRRQAAGEGDKGQGRRWRKPAVGRLGLAAEVAGCSGGHRVGAAMAAGGGGEVEQGCRGTQGAGPTRAGSRQVAGPAGAGGGQRGRRGRTDRSDRLVNPLMAYSASFSDLIKMYKVVGRSDWSDSPPILFANPTALIQTTSTVLNATLAPQSSDGSERSDKINVGGYRQLESALGKL
ncbi:uncharacterized protein LOC131860305 [Cryptomeria japonica]|uniref:uncharacterized protein LOC131860305 n=1 Tax=Cryptomeria japonica TaxID=3369 RepID=UPI0027DA29C0|nr:uncharacterized protein LOC131860305 [Cryptomeria japonica]